MKNKITITSLFMALISVFSLAVYASTENTLFNDNIQPVEVTQSETYSTTIPQNVLRGIRNMKDAEENPNVVPGEVIVKYKTPEVSMGNSNYMSTSEGNTKRAAMYNMEQSLRLNSLEIADVVVETPESTISLVKINDNKSVNETVNLLDNNPYIEAVEPNYIYHLDYTNLNGVETNDIYGNNQWALSYIDWPNAYLKYKDKLESSEPVTVAVLDDGVNYNHLDLKDSIWNPSSCIYFGGTVSCNHGYNFVEVSKPALPNGGNHGTHIAGIIAAGINNGKGIIGINPYAKIASLKAGENQNLTAISVIYGIYFAKENGIKILNASFGMYEYSELLSGMIYDYGLSGGLVIAAAGNDRKDMEIEGNKHYPAALNLDNIISVASSNSSGEMSDFSNYGAVTTDIAAPGSNIISTINPNEEMFKYYEDFDDFSAGNWSGGFIYPGYEFYFIAPDSGINSPEFQISGDINNELIISAGCLDEDLDATLRVIDNDTSTQIYEGNLTGNANYLYQSKIEIPEEHNHIKVEFYNATTGVCLIKSLTLRDHSYYSGQADTYEEMGGTSMATPYVAGLASLIWTLKPELTALEVKNLILENGDINPNFYGKTVSGKTINVLKTLDALNINSDAPTKPTGLKAGWHGTLRWDKNDSTASGYYYEVVNTGGNVIYQGTVTETGVTIPGYIEGDYTWRVQAVGAGDEKSEFTSGYICKEPVMERVSMSGFECNGLKSIPQISGDNCTSTYEIVMSNGSGEIVDPEEVVYLDRVGTMNYSAYIQNELGERTETKEITYEWLNSYPYFENLGAYVFTGTYIGTGQHVIMGDIKSRFKLRDGDCGEEKINYKSFECTSMVDKTPISTGNNSGLTGNTEGLTGDTEEGGVLTGTSHEESDLIIIETGLDQLSVFAYSTGTKSLICTGVFEDDEESDMMTGVFNITYTIVDAEETSGTIIETNPNINKPQEQRAAAGGGRPINWNNNRKASDDRKIDREDFLPKGFGSNFLEREEDDSSDKTHGSAPIDKWYEAGSNSESLANGYTREINNAFSFARKYGIVSSKEIESANIEGYLTRIAMSKMLSKYAINVLGMVPDRSKRATFNDVSDELDTKYSNGPTLAYQLGIMGINVQRFRPYDEVTRAEFVSALSRLLYNTPDGTNSQDGTQHYYDPHLNKFKQDGTITNADPFKMEKRGNAMLIMLRLAMKNNYVNVYGK